MGPNGEFHNVLDTREPFEVSSGDARDLVSISWYDVNNSDQLAYGVQFADSSGVFVADLLSVPEPSAIVIVLFGLASLVWYRRT